MKVKLKRLDTTLPLPRYETAGSVGFDLLARVDTLVEPGALALVPANLIVEVPSGYMLVVASRSSLPKKKGLLTPHGIGIIDHDYCGSEDEIRIQVYNFSENPVQILRGEKIAQGVFVRIDTFEWEEISEMGKESRGGFGSTGGYESKVNLDISPQHRENKAKAELHVEPVPIQSQNEPSSSQPTYYVLES